jgi:hypothetical protein
MNFHQALRSPVVQERHYPLHSLFSLNSTIFDLSADKTLRSSDLKTGISATMALPNIPQRTSYLQGITASATHFLLSDHRQIWSIDFQNRKCVWNIQLPPLENDEEYFDHFRPKHLFGSTATHFWTLIAKRERYVLSRWVLTGDGQAEKIEFPMDQIKNCQIAVVAGGDAVLVTRKGKNTLPWQRTLIDLNTGKIRWQRDAKGKGFWNSHFYQAQLTTDGIWAQISGDCDGLVCLDAKDGTIKKAFNLSDRRQETSPLSLVCQWSVTEPCFVWNYAFYLRFASFDALAKMCQEQIVLPETSGNDLPKESPEQAPQKTATGVDNF